MKINIRSISSFLLVAAIASCKKDNYKEPSAQLSGALQYKGEVINVERNQVPYQIYQYGFDKLGAINGAFAQEGTYGSLLFNGTYKFLIPVGQGPFMWKQLPSGAPDTLTITMSGPQTLNIEVTPYYMIRNAQISASGGKITATFKADKIITDANAKDIERVSLYINANQFVGPVGTDQIGSVDMAGTAITDPNNISLQINTPSLTQKYVYARVGLKIVNVEDMIFSPLTKVSF